MATPDTELLQRYGATRDDDAIAELVRRHVDLVYAAALRQVGGDAHLAEEVAQDVFLDCARKASVLQRRDNIVGWLYTSTHFAAAKRRRTESRRRAREEAYAMNHSISSPDPDWTQLRPVIDHAMQELGERDRETVLLRYFERHTVAEVGRRLGLTENAAAKAIERALDRLRRAIERHGISSAGSAVALLLSQQAVSAAPPAVAASIATAISTAGATATLGLTGFFLMSKTTIALAGATALILASAAFNLHQYRRHSAVQQELAALKNQWIRTELSAHEDRAALQAAQKELLAARGRAAAEDAARRSIPTPPANPPPAAAASATAQASTPEAKPFVNRGRTTPADLVETMMWATAQGDAKALAEATKLPDEDVALLQSWFDELPEETRRQFGSPEIAATAVMLSFSMVSGRDQGYVQILQQTEQEADTLRVRVRRGGAGGFRDRDEVVRRFADGWKIVPPPSLKPERKKQFQDTANSIAAAVKK